MGAGIRVEQVNLNNFSKIFLLRGDVPYVIDKNYIIGIFGMMTLDDLEEMGLVTRSREKQKLIDEVNICNDLYDNAIQGTGIGEYFPTAMNDFRTAIDTAYARRTETDPEKLMGAWRELVEAKDLFLKSVVTAEGVLFDNKWYGPELPPPSLELDGIEWVTVTIRDGYWISFEPIPANWPDPTLIYLRGLFYNDTIYTRESLPAPFISYTKVPGVIYDDIWFGEAQSDAITLEGYLQKPIDWVETDYYYSAANPPEIPEDGEVAAMNDIDITYLPANKEELLNVVAVIANSTLSANTKTTTGMYTMKGSQIKFIPTGTDVGVFKANMEIHPNATKRVYQSDGVTEVTTGPVDSTMIFRTISERGSVTRDFSMLVLEYYDQRATTEQVRIGDTVYGIAPDPAVPNWVPVKILNDKYYVSMVPIDTDNYPDARDYIQLWGIYNESDTRFYTREWVPYTILDQGTEKVNGTYWNNKWYGEYDNDALILSSYLTTPVGFAKSLYEYHTAEPPTIPEDGYVWYGLLQDYTTMPNDTDELKQYFNVVAKAIVEGTNLAYGIIDGGFYQ